ncbi:MAG: pilus assembly protein N-terminal domain-containing protein [Pseudomonadota bacterium]
MVGLTIASAIPFLNANNASFRPDPITTASVGTTVAQTAEEVGSSEMPPELEVAEPEADPAMAEAGEPVRKVIADAEPVLVAPVNGDAPAGAPNKMKTAGTEDNMATKEDPSMMVEPVLDASVDVELDETASMPEKMSGDDQVDAEVDEMQLAALAPSTMSTEQPLQGANQPPMTGNTVGVALDHARVMKVVGDVSTIIIGNPAIADATMPDPNTIVLTGKSFGETNMVMLDTNGEILAEQILQVSARGESMVSVYRGVQRTTFSCSPMCEIRPMPGDNAETLEAGLSAFEARNAAAVSAATGQ